ncbi:hypothetical protein J1G42_10025 [Cellulomonas sp. zg-ZUI222]|uniref:hypothetical protein n=1 Tax=Cellulomonas wangleii TaxID=2816956 RepID=UPI001A93B09F|nr:hypothetical protein [Cellulomonas wangleii]MBO0921161.1 hypothetical protein [Cellulomonas wangleii]
MLDAGGTTMANRRIEQLERATGRTWDAWLGLLGSWGAARPDHGTIAGRVTAEMEGTTPSAAWWARSVTVAYEQHIGRRLPGQRSDGTFQTSVSRATPWDMTDLMAAWTRFATEDDEVRDCVVGEPRVSGTERRITWRARSREGWPVAVTSEPRGGATATLVATQTGLPTPAAKDEARDRWVAVLDRFVTTVGDARGCTPPRAATR